MCVPKDLLFGITSISWIARVWSRASVPVDLGEEQHDTDEGNSRQIRDEERRTFYVPEASRYWFQKGRWR